MRKKELLDCLLFNQCKYCSYSLEKAELEYKEAEDGQYIEGYDKPQLVFLICPRCNSKQKMRLN